VDDYESGLIDGTERSGSRLGGVSLQTGASILLIAVIAAVLFLFLGPMPDGGTATDLPTATATRLAAALGGTPATGARQAAAPLGTAGAGQGVIAGTSPMTGTAAAARLGGIGFTAGTPAPGTPAASSGAAIRSGAFVAVTGTGIYGVRFRFGPGTDTNTIRIVSDGEVLLVMDESVEAEGATWWRVQDSHGNVGWVTDEYLTTGVLAPSSWAPPAASPTFPARAPGTPSP
jgi:hypothetical protein